MLILLLSVILNTYTINGTEWPTCAEVPLKNYSLTHAPSDSVRERLLHIPVLQLKYGIKASRASILLLSIILNTYTINGTEWPTCAEVPLNNYSLTDLVIVLEKGYYIYLSS